MNKLVDFLTAALERIDTLESGIQQKVMDVAVTSFGRLVKLGGAMTPPKGVGWHIERILDQLNETDILSSTIALRLLSELAKNAPARFSLNDERFVDKVYPFLFHDSASLRHHSLEALKVRISISAAAN